MNIKLNIDLIISDSQIAVIVLFICALFILGWYGTAKLIHKRYGQGRYDFHNDMACCGATSFIIWFCFALGIIFILAMNIERGWISIL